MRLSLWLICLACVTSASAQEYEMHYDSTFVVYLDSLRMEADAAGLAVLSIGERDGDLVYDLDGRDESRLTTWSNPLPGFGLVLRAPDIGRAMVLVEPYHGVPGAAPNAVLLGPERPAAMLQPEIGLQLVTEHRVRVYVCGQTSGQDMCLRWDDVPPRSGGDGLILTVVQGPERGTYYVPTPREDPPLEHAI